MSEPILSSLSPYAGLFIQFKKIGLIMIFFAVRDLINNRDNSLSCFKQALKSF